VILTPPLRERISDTSFLTVPSNEGASQARAPRCACGFLLVFLFSPLGAFLFRDRHRTAVSSYTTDFFPHPFLFLIRLGKGKVRESSTAARPPRPPFPSIPPPAFPSPVPVRSLLSEAGPFLLLFLNCSLSGLQITDGKPSLFRVSSLHPYGLRPGIESPWMTRLPLYSSAKAFDSGLFTSTLRFFFYTVPWTSVCAQPSLPHQRADPSHPLPDFSEGAHTSSGPLRTNPFPFAAILTQRFR